MGTHPKETLVSACTHQTPMTFKARFKKKRDEQERPFASCTVKLFGTDTRELPVAKINFECSLQ